MQHTPESWTITNILFSTKQENRTAIQFVDSQSVTLSALRTTALQYAGELQAQGVQAGDRVAVMANSPQFFCNYWLGITVLGATMVAINTSMQGLPLQHQLNVANVSLAVCEAQFRDVISSACNNIRLLTTETTSASPLPEDQVYPARPSDLACIMFTSGTSGPSKGVEMPHAHCVLFAIGTIENYRLTHADRFYICLPLFHANGLFMQLLACLAAGCLAIVREKFSASNWLTDIRQFEATHTNTLGAVAAFITAQPETADDTDHKLKVIGAAPLPASVEHSFRHRFGVPCVVPLYGMTEVNIPLYGSLNESAPGTCGKVYDRYFQVEIRDPDTDAPVTDGSTGEIMVRPKQPWGFMSGYAGMPDKTIEAWRNFWFHTGDAGYRNSNGQFVFVDRIKDCIRRRGENISTYEVEQAFLAMEGIAEAAAYAVPADGGEGMEDEVMVALQPAANTIIDDSRLLEIRSTASGNLAKFALPRYLRVMQELPKTPTGKIRKVVLREEGVTQDTVDTTAVS